MKKKVILLLYVSSLAANELHTYFWANYQQFRGNKEKANEWYTNMFAAESKPSIYTNRGYIHFLYDNNNNQRIVELMPKLDEVFKKDADVQLIFAQALKKTNAIKQADDKITQLAHQFPTHPEIVFQAAEAMVRNKEHTNALAIIDEYLNNSSRRPNNFIFSFLKAQIHSQLGDYKEARASIQTCLEAHPRFPQGWLLLALLEEQAGKLDQAIKGYTSYLEVAGSNKQIEQHLVGLVFKQNSLKNNRGMVVINKNCFEKAMILFERKQYKQALEQLDVCLSQNPQDPNMRLLKVQILTAMKAYDQTIDLLTEWSIKEPQSHIWLQALHLLPRTKVVSHASIIAALEKINQTRQNDLVCALYLADLYTRTNQAQKALDAHTKALGLATDNALKMRIAYQIALIYYENKQHDAMAHILESSDKLNIVYPPALNLLAYYYTTDKKHYDKAQALIDKALEHDPLNPHFLDTKALILYKKGDYLQSLNLLTQVVQEIPHDSTVLIHLAKVHKKLGNTYNALNIMQHAQRHALNDYEKKTTESLIQQWAT